jgi:hypothetical protein
MKMAKVTLMLRIMDEQPVQDWLIDLVEDKLTEGEELMAYIVEYSEFAPTPLDTEVDLD